MKNLIICIYPIVLCSCAVVEFTGKTVEMTGRVVRTGVKTTGTIVTTTGKIANSSGKVGAAGIRYAIGKRVIPLDRIGNSFYTIVKLNGRYNARLLVDTGATNVQISDRLARTMGIDTRHSRQVRCTLADGSTTYAKAVTLKEVKLGGTKVKNVEALVIESDGDGLLGMSYLNNFIFELDPENSVLVLRSKTESH